MAALHTAGTVSAPGDDGESLGSISTSGGRRGGWMTLPFFLGPCYLIFSFVKLISYLQIFIYFSILVVRTYFDMNVVLHMQQLSRD